MAEDEQMQRPSSRVSRSQQRRRQRSVFQYITILFAAALVLLFYTFMMERRQYEQEQQQSQASINDLQQQSVSAVQTLQGMTEENKALKDKVSELEKQVEALEDQLAGGRKDLADLRDQLQKQEDAARAMDWFWQIDEAYVRNKSSLCRELIVSFEDTGLTAALPGSSATGTDRPSPAERYQEICDKVIK